MMSTEQMQPLDLSEDRLDKLDPRCSHLDGLSDQFIKDCELKKKPRKGRSAQAALDVEVDQRKPRRKDTPVPHIPPFTAGVLSEHLITSYEVQERHPESETSPALQNTDLEQKKPRRKDTPSKHQFRWGLPAAREGGERVCVLETLWLLWKRGLLSLSPLLRSPSVPDDIPETPVTDALKATG
uniref:Protein phosphatase 1 regulatory subunit 17 n=1 Tax=Pipistrellus kuhlii TaxID=59472 RepID=A0A7J7TPQ5_PIPKU|nr:protein phosphatase 1 regulatory subunit 17 [Pipistrellus kuhlii]